MLRAASKRGQAPRAGRERISQHADRRVDFGLGVVAMRAEAQVVAAFAVVAERRDDARFFQRREERRAADAGVAEGRDAARVRAAARAEDLEIERLELADEMRLQLEQPLRDPPDGRRPRKSSMAAFMP
jgi:hypothetical protein